MSLNLEDIARLAGVSRSTVSRVINDQPNVSENTRQRVWQIVEEHNFRPNLAARSLVTQRTRVIGIFYPHPLQAFTPYYFPTLLQGIVDTTHDRDYATLLWWAQSSEEKERFSKRILQQNRLMDGLIIASAPIDDPLIQRIVELEIPFVMVERPTRFEDKIGSVTIDNVKAAQVAVEYLISLGRRRIGHITGAMNNIDGRDRVTGYRQALEAQGLPFDPALVVEGKFNRNSGYLGMKELLTRNLDAVFAGNDDMAVGALQALNEAGVRIPHDVAVVGFDDLPTALESSPQITTVHQPIQEKGALATGLLLDLIEGVTEEPRQIILPTHLVIRQSCGGPA